jgi:hypothetical protein
MSRYQEFDPERLDLRAFSQIPHTVSQEQFCSLPTSGASFSQFWNSLPAIYAGAMVHKVTERMVEARLANRAIVLACGAHVVKCGLAPAVIALMQAGFISALAVNGATSIHDVEIGLFGETSELVETGLQEGTFGAARETGDFVNAATISAQKRNEGGGEALGRLLCERQAPYLRQSLLASAYALHIPVTVHVAVATDFVHMHPGADGAAIGAVSLRDFRILTAAMQSLKDGGVLLNIGSAVLLPEILLKAMASLRNADPTFGRFLGVNMDMIQHYRANKQIVDHVKAIGGEGISLTGHHEIMIPLLAFAVLEEWSARRVKYGPDGKNTLESGMATPPCLGATEPIP